jgi:hypothetical protein
MFGDVNVDDPPLLVGQNHADKEHLGGDRQHNKEFQRDEVLHMVL